MLKRHCEVVLQTHSSLEVVHYQGTKRHFVKSVLSELDHREYKESPDLTVVTVMFLKWL